MMQATKSRHRNDPKAFARVLFCPTTGRRLLRQRKMSSVLMIVTDVFFHQPPQMALIQYDDMVEQISSTVPNPSFCNAVLPRAPEAGSFRLDAHVLNRAYHFLIEVRSPIEDQILRGRIVGECFAQLLYDPCAVWMACNFQMQNTPPVMRNYEEAVQHAESQCRHGEEIHRGDRFPMIAQKCHPRFCRLGTSRCSPHPAQHGSFRNIEAEHLQFAVNARSAPGRVLSNHAKDELTQFRADTFSARTGAMPREPRPIGSESRTVPANNRLRLNENQRRLPSTPEPPQYHPEQSARSRKTRLWMSLPQNRKLLPKRQVFQKQVAAGAKELNC